MRRYRRPHFTPEARFRILTIRTLLALSADDPAMTVRVSTATILRWQPERSARRGGRDPASALRDHVLLRANKNSETEDAKTIT